MKSKYLETFKNAQIAGKKDYALTGDCLLVELMPEEEKKTKSGLIMTSMPESHKELTQGVGRPVFCHVLMVGDGYYKPCPECGDFTGMRSANYECPTCKNEGVISPEMEVNPGDVILVGELSVAWFKTFGTLVSSGTMVGITRASEIKMIFEGYDGYRRFFSALEEQDDV
jgi:hypothetical protein